MPSLRPAELAGSHYPQAEAECRDQLNGWPPLAPLTPFASAVGCIIPHGGWRYAGRIATGTLKTLQNYKQRTELNVVIGGHLEPGDPVRVFIEGDWETPLGAVPTPTSLAETIAIGLSAEPETAEEYYDDNAVEVLMPILKHLWPNTPALVIGVPPDAPIGVVAQEITKQLKSHQVTSAVVIGSVDLTHYGPDYRFRPQGSGPAAYRWVLKENDASLLRHLEKLDAHAIAWEGPRKRNTCSAGAAATTAALAKKWQADRGQCLVHSTSWDEDNQPSDMHSYIGYAGVLFGCDAEDTSS
ncbi:MAG: AmmeMemoRadiSam system protein B [Myxococcales bacterium]|nr:AmmeMemoRadiSam system protein B [Myxococcales bacterium]